jgi:ATP-dependent Clp protease ATP-binding subunit ClpB
LTTAWAQGEEGFDDAKQRVMEELRKHFRPEFLNRVDDIVVFHPLNESQLEHIVDLRLDDLRKLLADRRITLELTEPARKAIFKAGYDPVYGARPLKRAIQRMVQDSLAMQILEGKVLHGDHVVIDADSKGKLEFRTREALHAADALRAIG